MNAANLTTSVDVPGQISPVPNSSLLGLTQALNSTFASDFLNISQQMQNERISRIGGPTETAGSAVPRDRAHLSLDLTAGLRPKFLTQQNHLISPSSATTTMLMDPKLLADKAKGLLSSTAALSVATAETPTTPTYAAIFPRNVTKAQEIFADGFQKALSRLHNDPSTVVSPGQFASPSTVHLILSAALASARVVLSPSGSNSLQQQLGGIIDSGKFASPTDQQTPSDVSSSNSIRTTTESSGSSGSQASSISSPAMNPSFFSDQIKGLNPQGFVYPSIPGPFTQFFGSSPHQELLLNTSSHQNQQQQQPTYSHTSTTATSNYPLPPPYSLPQQQVSSSSQQAGPSGSSSMAAVKFEETAGFVPPTKSKSSKTATPRNFSVANKIIEANMSEQEHKRLERKRARNRAAASKCRQKKLERIQELEGEVNREKQRSEELEHQIHRLQCTIGDLNQQLVELAKQHHVS